MDREQSRQLTEAMERLTLQVARLAYAVEELSLDDNNPEAQPADTCKRCGCRLVPEAAEKCPVCGEDMPQAGRCDVSEEEADGERSEVG